MKEKYEVNGSTLIVNVPRELDHHVADGMRGELDMLLKTTGISNVLFNFEDTEFMDSSGIGVIIGRYRELKYLGGQVTLTNLNDRMKRIVKMSGLERIVNIK